MKKFFNSAKALDILTAFVMSVFTVFLTAMLLWAVFMNLNFNSGPSLIATAFVSVMGIGIAIASASIIYSYIQEIIKS